MINCETIVHLLVIAQNKNISLQRKCACGNLRIRLPPPPHHGNEGSENHNLNNFRFFSFISFCSAVHWESVCLITAWNDWMTVNIELERTRKEVTLAYFKFYKFSVSTFAWTNWEKSWNASGQSVSVHIFMHVNNTYRSACKILQRRLTAKNSKKEKDTKQSLWLLQNRALCIATCRGISVTDSVIWQYDMLDLQCIRDISWRLEGLSLTLSYRTNNPVRHSVHRFWADDTVSRVSSRLLLLVITLCLVMESKL
jgi:hypothetical protein